MQVTAIHTPLIRAHDDLFQIITTAVPEISERSILVIASKAFSTAENRFVEKKTGTREEKHELVKQEAEYYLEPHSSKYNMMLTIKRNWMFVNAGIDESNADGKYLLWPEDPQQSLNDLWLKLKNHYVVKEFGLTMSDSCSFPLNWGVIAMAIAYCGFKPLKSYIGKPDLFGREMKMEQVNVAQAVTVAGALQMGEGNECTPMALVTDIGEVEFQDYVPTVKELKELKIELEDDAYAPILLAANWKSSAAKAMEDERGVND